MIPKYFISPPAVFQETDSRGERGGASAGQSAHPAAAAVRPPEVSQRISGVGSAVRAQLLPVRPAEPAALGRGAGVGTTRSALEGGMDEMRTSGLVLIVSTWKKYV